ncbi:MAG TPA: hypothetical protein VHI13_21320 [Candidatus Kapabacteria bacterium]|nr:hypothetical protein [Candidatus Kapabacteria bacterium]
MAVIEYIVFFDNNPATQDQLDRIEDVTVEQEVDLMWEARVQIPVCVDNDGRWAGEEEAWMKEFTRVRIEARIGDNPFVPLIDGPIVGYDTARSGVPGKSIVTLVVRDDSVYLHREESITLYEGLADSAIARRIFGETQQLAGSPPDIPAETTEPPGSLPALAVQRGTQMQLLRALAARHHNWHAYVLPGTTPGKSIGAFREFPTRTDGLPPMVLLGDNQNIKEFTVRNNQQRASDVQTSSLSIADRTITTATASFRDQQLVGDEPATGTSGNTAKRTLRPGTTDTVDPHEVVRGAAALSGYTLDASGSVVPGCYQGILSPYRLVEVQISDSRFSGNYVITKVTHTLTRSTYTQSFSAKGNAVSSSNAAAASMPRASALAEFSFNAQGSIF